jgi:hypothetical protein
VYLYNIIKANPVMAKVSKRIPIHHSNPVFIINYLYLDRTPPDTLSLSH